MLLWNSFLMQWPSDLHHNFTIKGSSVHAETVPGAVRWLHNLTIVLFGQFVEATQLVYQPKIVADTMAQILLWLQQKLKDFLPCVSGCTSTSGCEQKSWQRRDRSPALPEAGLFWWYASHSRSTLWRLLLIVQVRPPSRTGHQKHLPCLKEQFFCYQFWTNLILSCENNSEKDIFERKHQSDSKCYCCPCQWQGQMWQGNILGKQKLFAQITFRHDVYDDHQRFSAALSGKNKVPKILQKSSAGFSPGKSCTWTFH